MACSRRCLLAAACACPAGAFAARLQAEPPSADAAAPGVTEVDLAKLPEGALTVVHWRGQPVWVLHRTPEMIRRLASPELHAQLADPGSTLGDAANTPSYARNTLRAIRAEYFVGLAVCPHAGCQPVPRLQPGPNPEQAGHWPGGFACQCHFATFDLAGRVFRGKPTSENIPIPRHMYPSEATLVIGRDAEGEA